MKTLSLIALLALTALSNTASAKTLCSFYCASVIEQDGKMVYGRLSSTLYVSDEENVVKVISNEMPSHCEKVQSGSKPVGILYLNEAGEIEVKSLNGINVPVSSCTKI